MLVDGSHPAGKWRSRGRRRSPAPTEAMVEVFASNLRVFGGTAASRNSKTGTAEEDGSMSEEFFELNYELDSQLPTADCLPNAERALVACVSLRM